MSGERYEDVARTLKLTSGVRWSGDELAIGVRVFRGAVHVSTENVLLSVDDASVMNAQLTRLLNERAFPGMS